MSNKVYSFIICLFISFYEVNSHGRMNDPPARNAMWRYGFAVPPNYNDLGLNCGGVGLQHQKNGGKCGICGDAWDSDKPHELGGQWATGIVGKTYKIGQVIDVNILLSANHRGYFEFKICPITNEEIEATQECLDQNILKINGRGLRYNVLSEDKEINLKVQLPSHMTCKRCVMQWRYRTGNSWGSKNGKAGLGIGQQEEFWNCADVSISLTGIAAPYQPHQIVKSITKTAPLTQQPESLIDFIELEQLTTAIYISKNPPEPSTKEKGQIACALHGVEPNQKLLFQKISVCLQNCQKDITRSCPSDCYCIWTVDE